MSTRWRGGNWTAGNWDANNWLGPNQPPPPGSISGSATITITLSGTLTSGASGFISGSASFSIAATGTLTATGVQPPVELPAGAGSGGFAGVSWADQVAARRAKQQAQDAQDMEAVIMAVISIIDTVDDERWAA